MNKPKYIIVHTAAFRGDVSLAEITQWHTDPYQLSDGKFRYLGKLYNSANELPQEVRNRRGNGWLDIGYHYVIRKDGTLEIGRNESRSGAHCSDMGMNSKSIGLCFSGHGNHEIWTPGQRHTFFDVLAPRLRKAYTIPIRNVLGHRETGANKDCPGTLIDMYRVREMLTNRHSGLY